MILHVFFFHKHSLSDTERWTEVMHLHTTNVTIRALSRENSDLFLYIKDFLFIIFFFFFFLKLRHRYVDMVGFDKPSSESLGVIWMRVL